MEWYVCISSRGPLPPLDLELYSRASQVMVLLTLLVYVFAILFRMMLGNIPGTIKDTNE